MLTKWSWGNQIRFHLNFHHVLHRSWGPSTSSTKHHFVSSSFHSSHKPTNHEQTTYYDSHHVSTQKNHRSPLPKPKPNAKDIDPSTHCNLNTPYELVGTWFSTQPEWLICHTPGSGFSQNMSRSSREHAVINKIQSNKSKVRKEITKFDISRYDIAANFCP